MLVIRLQRTGRENVPSYRIVLSEKARHAKKGTIEIIGHYLPGQAKPVFECKKDRVEHWVKMGAHPSNTLARLLKKAGVAGMDKFIERYAKQKSKSEQPAAAPPAAEAAPTKTEEKKEEAKKEEPKAEEKKEEPKA